MKRILVRFDDICPTMDFHQFKLAMDLMDMYGVRPLIGVIPDCQDPDLKIEEYHSDFWDFIKSLQERGYVIAMHGYAHVFDSQARGIVVDRVGSEFAGCSYEAQVEKLRKGKLILEQHGIFTDIFFAPGHSYDNNTLRALSACGFKYMSDGKSQKPYCLCNVKCIPCKSGGIPRMRFGVYHTAVIHTNEWTAREGKKDFQKYIELIQNHHEEIIAWNEYASIPCGNVYVQRLIEVMYVKYQKHLHPFIEKLLRP